MRILLTAIFAAMFLLTPVAHAKHHKTDDILRALVFYYQQQYESAIEDYNRAVEFNPFSAEAYFNRGNAYVYSGLYNLAIEDYNRAIELNPLFSDAYNNRGVAYKSLGKYWTAISDFQRAVELNEFNFKAKENLESCWQYVFSNNGLGITITTSK